MVDPPSELGAEKATVAAASPADADVIVGVVGTTGEMVNVTSFVPAEYAAVAAAVARTAQDPAAV